MLTNIWKDMGENCLKEVYDRKPEDGGLIDRENFPKELNAVSLTREQKAIGVPSI